MKKTILTIAIILISISGFAQKRTSQDVLNKIQLTLKNNIVEVNPDLSKLFDEYRTLYIQELRLSPTKDMHAMNPGEGGYFCFMCRCVCGCIITQGNCANYPNPCGGNCSCCGRNSWTVLVSMCTGSMCGMIIGAN